MASIFSFRAVVQSHFISPHNSKGKDMHTTLPMRPHASTYLLRTLALGRCLHIDMWAKADKDELWLYCEFRSGGREIIMRSAWGVDSAGQAIECDWREIPANVVNVAWNDRLVDRGIRGRINAAHWRTIYPLVNEELPAPYKSKSVVLHYVRVPALSAVTADMLNWYRPGRGIKNSTRGRGDYRRVGGGLPDILRVE